MNIAEDGEEGLEHELIRPRRVRFLKRHIARTITYLHPDGRFEIRAKLPGERGVRSRIFNAGEHRGAAEYAAGLSGQAIAIWISTGQINVGHPRHRATSAEHIDRRRSILVDFDPNKPKELSSSEAEHDAARERAIDCGIHLMQEFGFPPMLAGDSGSGAHLLIVVDLPNDKATSNLIQRFLQALARKFDDDKVAVDTGNFNAARVTKIFGTLARKGPNSIERPHRLARVLLAPDERPDPVPAELLQEVINAYLGEEAKPESLNPQRSSASVSRTAKSRNILPLLERLGGKEKRFLRFGEIPEGKTRSDLIQSVALSAVNFRWTFEQFAEVMLTGSNQGSAKIFELPASRRWPYLERCWDKAVAYFNERPSISSSGDIRHTIQQILSNLDHLRWKGRTASTDRAVFQAHLTIAHKIARSSYTASVRQVAENSGYGARTVAVSQRRLRKRGLIKLIPGKSLSSCWELPLDRFRHIIKSSECVIYCVEIDQPSSAHDTWQPGALGKTGWLVWTALQANRGMSLAELLSKLPVSKPTVNKRLKQLKQYGLAKCVEWLWYRGQRNLDEIAEILQTKGRGLRRKEQHRLERQEYHRRLQMQNGNDPDSNVIRMREASGETLEVDPATGEVRAGDHRRQGSAAN